MAETPTVGDLVRQRLITDSEVNAAVEAYFEAPKTVHFEFSGGYSLYLAALVRTQQSVRKMLRDPDASEALKRAAVRKAILLARPLKN